MTELLKYNSKQIKNDVRVTELKAGEQGGVSGKVRKLKTSRCIIIIIMVIFKCYFSGELIALSYNK